MFKLIFAVGLSLVGISVFAQDSARAPGSRGPAIERNHGSADIEILDLDHDNRSPAQARPRPLLSAEAQAFVRELDALKVPLAGISARELKERIYTLCEKESLAPVEEAATLKFDPKDISAMAQLYSESLRAHSALDAREAESEARADLDRAVNERLAALPDFKLNAQAEHAASFEIAGGIRAEYRFETQNPSAGLRASDRSKKLLAGGKAFTHAA